MICVVFLVPTLEFVLNQLSDLVDVDSVVVAVVVVVSIVCLLLLVVMILLMVKLAGDIEKCVATNGFPRRLIRRRRDQSEHEPQ
jgi:hypothetical protein